MEQIILGSSLFLVTLMLLSLYRAVKGPTTLDRLMGMNAIGSKTTVLIIMIGLIFGRVEMFVDIALTYGMLNFIAVLAASRYLHKRGLRPMNETTGKE
ncbi:monovalent cation/H+ antiporter complex subunit F [Desulfohalovibrio reitneri]|jgi:multicomponent Na+:H+ antiporter subunit F|uniref:monovalent cation/H+ antiporter complex subunit F n=1 Tax=Desulfohalovibrio reitneri TaxID=1307759 RepID=UPI0004A77AB8|nr:monovalent cation/H+ antiporter complex subunit F [Desulfohalovibrio reitneri]